MIYSPSFTGDVVQFVVSTMTKAAIASMAMVTMADIGFIFICFKFKFINYLKIVEHRGFEPRSYLFSWEFYK